MKIILAIILPVLLLLAGSCNEASPTTPAAACYPAGYTCIDYSDGDSTIPEQGVFRLDKIIWGPFSIYIFGTVDLAEGARLQAQLYKDEQAVKWWPASHGTRVRDGKWETSVKAHQYGSPEELPDLDEGYSLRVWNRDNPIVMAEFSLTVSGQPHDSWDASWFTRIGSHESMER